MMRKLINLVESLLTEATLNAEQITRYPERFDAFITHIQDGKPFYTDKEGTEVILEPSEADRFLELHAAGQFRGRMVGQGIDGKQYPLSSFRKTAEFGGASTKPGDDSEVALSKEGVMVKPTQIGITDRDIKSSKLAAEISSNQVLASTVYGQSVIAMANNIAAGAPAIMPRELLKNDALKKAIVDYAGEYLGVLALVNNQTNFPNREDFLNWLGGSLDNLTLNFPSKSNTQIADSFASIINPTTEHQINISSKGTGGGAAPSLSGLVVPDSVRKKKTLKAAVEFIDLTQDKSLAVPRSISQVFASMNLIYEHVPKEIPDEFHKFLPWSDEITAQVQDSIKNGTPMPKYAKLIEATGGKGTDGGKLTYVTKLAVMKIVNSGALPGFQAAILETLDYNFIQQYTTVNGRTGQLVFETQWPAKLNGVVTLETKSGGTDPTKGGFSFKLKPVGSAADTDAGSPGSAEAAPKAKAVKQRVDIKPPSTRANRTAKTTNPVEPRARR